MEKESINQEEWASISRDIDNIMMIRKWENEERSYNNKKGYSSDDQNYYEESDISDSSDDGEIEGFEDADDEESDTSDSFDEDMMKSYEGCPYCDDY